MKISIITPVYNGEKFIRRTMDSIHSQQDLLKNILQKNCKLPVNTAILQSCITASINEKSS